MSIKKTQEIDAIGKIASRKISDNENIIREYDEIVDEIEELKNDLASLSIKINKEKNINTIYLVDDSSNICDHNLVKKKFSEMVGKKQKRWIDDIKKYYQVELNSEDFEEYINSPIKTDEKVQSINKKIKIEAWQSIKGLFFEWFTIMVFLDCFFDEEDGGVIDLTGFNSVKLNINNNKLYLRNQKNVANKFKLQVKPDILLTDSGLPDFDYRNVLGLIECKYLDGNIDAKDIRDIFAKGWQILPHHICIISRNQLNNKNKDASKGFGINVIDNLRYDTYRTDLYKNKYSRILYNESFKEKLIKHLNDKYHM